MKIWRDQKLKLKTLQCISYILSRAVSQKPSCAPQGYFPSDRILDHGFVRVKDLHHQVHLYSAGVIDGWLMSSHWDTQPQWFIEYTRNQMLLNSYSMFMWNKEIKMTHSVLFVVIVIVSIQNAKQNAENIRLWAWQ